MSKKLPKKLDLGMASMGGHPHFYARNVIRGGDYATVGHYVGNIQENAEILIVPHDEFNTPAYLEQFKAHLLAINPDLVFTNDKPVIDVEQVIEKANKYIKLMGFEVDMIRNNPEKLHEIYLAAKPKKLHSLPSQYDYELANGMYPLIQVWDAVTTIIHG